MIASMPRRCWWMKRRIAAFVVGSAIACGAFAASPGEPGEEVWITLGSDAFVTANRAIDLASGGFPLTRLDEAGGVVLARMPRAGLEALGGEIHRELRRCGGFIVHASLADARAALPRLASTSRTPAGLGFVIDQPHWVGAVAGAVDEAQILATITTLSTSFANRYHAHPSGTAAATWIRDLWASYAASRPDVTVALVTHTTTVQPSVVLTIPGTTLASEVVVLGGHLDSIAPGTGNPNFSGPGADDDASGIATLSEVVRVALAAGIHPQRTIQFMAYAAEEVGLFGSEAIAASYLAAGTNVVAVLQQDMTGYNGSTEDIAFISDFTNALLNTFLVDLLTTYQPALTWTTTACGYACSDHAPWHNRGFPAAFAFEAKMFEDNPFIHTTSDTVATLGGSAAHAAKFARLAAAFMVEAGLDGSNGIFADGFEDETTGAWSFVLP
jgi:leucyl aminopeptidase